MEWIALIIFYATSFFVQQAVQQVQQVPTLYLPVVHHVYPHDSGSFTQGLVWNGETFYESAGLYGQSDLREVVLDTGDILREQPVADEYFAEGLAQVDDRLIQITWQENVAFVYDAATFEVVGQFEYDTQGWGLCYDGERLAMSDGTSTLYFRDPQTFEILDSVTVTLQGEPQASLNELECVDGLVYANVWQTDYIVIIDPANGRIMGVIYAGGLLTQDERVKADVLNGIAYNPDTERFYITGKWWPHLFEVTFEEYVP